MSVYIYIYICIYVYVYVSFETIICMMKDVFCIYKYIYLSKFVCLRTLPLCHLSLLDGLTLPHFRPKLVWVHEPLKMVTG